MSNPLDSAIETLKRAEPRPEAVGRAVAALRRPHPSRLVPLTVGVAALSALALWPHGTAGLAWSQVAAQDLPVRYHEWSEANGRRGMETWVDRALGARRIRSSSHSVVEGYESIVGPQGSYSLINGVATYSRKRDRRLGFARLVTPESVRERTSLQSLLGSPRFRQVGVERDARTRVGTADRYTLKRIPTESQMRFVASARAYFDHPMVVYVQPRTGRILGYDDQYMEGPGQTTIEYPKRLPADTFAIPPKDGPPPYDLDAVGARLRARLASPIASLRVGGQTAQLRLVAQDAYHALWIVWTGTKPNGDLKERVTVLGRHNGDAFGTMTLTNKDRLGRTPFGGHAVKLDRRVDRVDLRIPVFAEARGRSRLTGYATVRNVAVEQIPGLQSVFPALGLKGRMY